MDAVWYRISPREEGGADLDTDWFAAFKRDQMCAAGRHRRRELWSVPVEIHLKYHPGPYPCYLTRAGLYVVRREFMEFLAGYAPEYLCWGPVYVGTYRRRELIPATRPDSRIASLVAPFALPLRGGPESERKVCPACNAFTYWPLPYGQDYILRSSLKAEQQVYLCGVGYFVVTEGVLDRIPPRLRKYLYWEQVPVRDEAEDGIVEFPTIGI